ncbi:putative ribonuclease H-like domain-containing protein [Tanacetum coccineum]|uniref:Ribonuclease H-like domain-containing protein n=1 Tax=Tanacetum coccineum TaxID=301880 RepID=A0ABQ5F782_9ASTR
MLVCRLLGDPPPVDPHRHPSSSLMSSSVGTWYYGCFGSGTYIGTCVITHGGRSRKQGLEYSGGGCLMLRQTSIRRDPSPREALRNLQVVLAVSSVDIVGKDDYVKFCVCCIDPLGKFDGKADEGFLVGYSINSKAFRVFNTRTRKVEENLHINFLENKPNVTGSGPEWLFDIDSLTKSMNYEPVTTGNQTNGDAGIETNVNAGQAGQEKASDNEYILLPLMLSNSPLSSSTQSTDDKDADEVPDKGDDDVSQRNGQEKEGGASNKEDDQHVQDFRAELDNLLVQQKEGYANSTNRDSTASPSVSTAGPSINTASENINTGSPNINTASPIPNDSSMQSLENTGIFDDAYDDREVGAEADLNNLETTMNVSPIPTTRIHKDHPKDQIIGDINSATQTRRMTKISEEHAMVWTLVDLPKGKRDIGNKWVYQNKKYERGIVVRNKARLVAQGLIVYQMDVKSAFLYVTIEEEVYVCQPSGFKDPQFPDKSVFIKKDKGELTFFLGLQVMQKDDGIFISQDKYVADILKKFDFVTIKTTSTPIETNKALLKDEEAEDMDVHLYRSMIGSLMYLKTSKPDIMFAVCACVRFQVTHKVSHLNAVKRIFKHLKGQPKLGLWYPRDSPFDLEAFFDSDYAGASLDRKSTTGGCQFLGKRLISWQFKKQTIVANSTTEAEYVAAANCCGQVLWIQNQMLDYGFNFMNTKIHIHNERTICIVKNPVFHSKTKHIEIWHHFIRDSYGKKLIQVIKIYIDHNVVDLLTKAFDVSRTTKISQSSGPIHLDADETVYKEWEDKMERAATTTSSLEAEQDNGNINKTQSMATLNESIPQGTDSEKPKESNRFEEIIDFLNASSVQYALTINPTIYTTCIEQFWTSAKVKTVTGERQIQALVDKKKVIISETSIRSDLKLDDAEGTDCLPTATIFAELERTGYENLTQKLTFYKAYFSSQWKFLIHTILQCLSAKTTSWNEFSSTMASAIICLATNQKFNLSNLPRQTTRGNVKYKGVYVTPSHTKKVFANIKRPCKGFSGRVTPLFSTMMVQATEDMGVDSATPIDSHSIPIITQPSSSKPQKKKSRRKQRHNSAPIEPTTAETTPEEHEKVLNLEKAKTTQAKEIASLKKRVKQLEKRRKSRNLGLRRLRKISSSSRVESSNDASLGAQEDASKQGRKIEDLDADA